MQDDALIELEIRIAFQDRKIDELDTLVRTLATRLETTERELAEVKRAMAPEEHLNERPPHY
jgi:uncharacterized coiled-coil protein SlyX